jgi:nicotinamidase-related amidase
MNNHGSDAGNQLGNCLGASVKRLPVPPHFQAARVGEVWRVAYQDRFPEARAWAERHGVTPAQTDTRRVALLLIDVQNTFCLPDFELYVGGRSGTGAIEDNTRLCEFIYRHLGVITHIVPTLDTHHVLQIFHPIFWVDAKGRHPQPAQTIITSESVCRGTWRINPAVAAELAPERPAALTDYAAHYVAALEKSGKFPLMIWPWHAMLGGIGHALVAAVEEAIFFHSTARCCRPRFELKGDSPWTENYSVLAPEVTQDQHGKPVGTCNARLIDELLSYDTVIVAGQAKSHCLAWTVEDLLAEITRRNPAFARRVFLLEDCTSPVVIPGVIDFTEAANQSFAKFAAAGMRLIRSDQPLELPELPVSRTSC